jgi:hypothetical protein
MPRLVSTPAASTILKIETSALRCTASTVSAHQPAGGLKETLKARVRKEAVRADFFQE